MTYFIIPHIHNNILPSHLKIKFIEREKNKPFINLSISEYTTQIKELIDEHSKYWDSIKKFTNPYEFIHTNLPNSNNSISNFIPISVCKIVIEIYNTFTHK